MRILGSADNCFRLLILLALLNTPSQQQQETERDENGHAALRRDIGYGDPSSGDSFQSRDASANEDSPGMNKMKRSDTWGEEENAKPISRSQRNTPRRSAIVRRHQYGAPVRKRENKQQQQQQQHHHTRHTAAAHRAPVEGGNRAHRQVVHEHDEHPVEDVRESRMAQRDSGSRCSKRGRGRRHQEGEASEEIRRGRMSEYNQRSRRDPQKPGVERQRRENVLVDEGQSGSNEGVREVRKSKISTRKTVSPRKTEIVELPYEEPSKKEKDRLIRAEQWTRDTKGRYKRSDQRKNEFFELPYEDPSENERNRLVITEHWTRDSNGRYKRSDQRNDHRVLRRRDLSPWMQRENLRASRRPKQRRLINGGFSFSRRRKRSGSESEEESESEEQERDTRSDSEESQWESGSEQEESNRGGESADIAAPSAVESPVESGEESSESESQPEESPVAEESVKEEGESAAGAEESEKQLSLEAKKARSPEGKVQSEPIWTSRQQQQRQWSQQEIANSDEEANPVPESEPIAEPVMKNRRRWTEAKTHRVMTHYGGGGAAEVGGHVGGGMFRSSRGQRLLRQDTSAQVRPSRQGQLSTYNWEINRGAPLGDTRRSRRVHRKLPEDFEDVKEEEQQQEESPWDVQYPVEESVDTARENRDAEEQEQEEQNPEQGLASVMQEAARQDTQSDREHTRQEMAAEENPMQAHNFGQRFQRLNQPMGMSSVAAKRMPVQEDRAPVRTVHSSGGDKLRILTFLLIIPTLTAWLMPEIKIN